MVNLQTEQIQTGSCAKKGGENAGIRITAAGLAGTIFAAGLTGMLTVPAKEVRRDPAGSSGREAVRLRDETAMLPDSVPARNCGDGSPSGAFRPHTPQSSGAGSRSWNEEEVLRRWDLDPDDFPKEGEEAGPQIPDDLLPYFREETSAAVWSWAGQTPPQGDLSAFSLRADAIRDAVRRKAQDRMKSWSRELAADFLSLLESSQDQYLTAFCRDFLQEGPSAAAAFRADQSRTSAEEEIRAVFPHTGTGPVSQDARSPVYAFLEGHKDAGQTCADRPENDPAYDAGEAEDMADHPVVPKEEAEDMAGRPAVFSSEWWKLPVPPDLYDFTPLFPADETKQLTRGGYTLFPGIPDPTGMTRSVREGLRTQRQEAELRQWQRQQEASGQDGDVSSGYEPEDTDPFAAGQDGDISSRNAAGSKAAVPFSSVSGMSGDSDFDAGRAQPSVSPRRTVFIGDSRTVGMKMYVGGEENEYWSARNSMGYSWMVDTGVPAVEDLIGENTDVVILMGVNDLGNVYRYADYINARAAEWKSRGAETYFVSVTPVDDRRSPNAKNSRIESFNDYMQTALEDVHYIDAYSRIRYSFGSPDGIHFDGATYREIYRIIHFYLYKGWYEESGLWFWFDHGRPQTGWLYLDGQWQYMDGSGVRWIRNSRVGDVVLTPYPETELLDPYQSILH